MVARMLLVWLLVLNLGVAAWWTLHRAPAPSAAVALDPSVPTLELVTRSDTRVAATTTPLTDVPAAPVGTPAVAAPEPAAPAQPAVQVCASFGPYADAAAAAQARGLLQAAGAQVGLRQVGAVRAGRGYNVFLPPLASREAALAMAERLRAAGFNDLVVLNDAANANGIALGRFGSEENALRHQADLQAKGFGAQVAPVGGDAAAGGATYWLDARAAAPFDPQAERTRIRAPGVRGC